jgi:hypothetical protein
MVLGIPDAAVDELVEIAGIESKRGLKRRPRPA